MSNAQRKPTLRGIEERNALVLKYRPLVYRVASELWNRVPKIRAQVGYEKQELISYGHMGLIRAAERFDPTHVSAATAKTFIYGCLWRYILDSAIDNAYTIRVPSGPQWELAKGKRTISSEKVLKAAVKAMGITGLPEVVRSKPKQQRDFLLVERVFYELKRIPKNQQIVIRARFGIGTREMTLQELADEFGVTRERIRQIQEQGLNRIRKALKGEKPCKPSP